IREPCFFLLCSHHLLVVYVVVANTVVTGDDREFSINLFLVLGDVQHRTHKRPIGLLASGYPCVAVHCRVWQVVSKKSAFGAFWHDNGIFGLLGLDQRQHLGAKVFAPIRPPESTASDSTEPDMYPGYFGRMHPEFRKWLRHRSEWNPWWCQFEAAPAVTGINIGSVGSLHNGEELAQHPVCVQSRDLFKSFM